jgi:hypothetical protein
MSHAKDADLLLKIINGHKIMHLQICINARSRTLTGGRIALSI